METAKIKYKPFKGIVLQNPEDSKCFLKSLQTPITEEDVKKLKEECRPFEECICFAR